MSRYCNICGETQHYVVMCEHCYSFLCYHHYPPEKHNCKHTRTKNTYQKAHYKKTRYYRKKKSNAKLLLIPLFLVMLIATYMLVDSNSVKTNSTFTLPEINIPFITQEEPTQEELIQYALDLINKDRNIHGQQNVTLSSVNSAQLHAEDMLKNSYYSHWDLNGYKAYMRYTLVGGKGAVAENIAYRYTIGGKINVEESIEKLQWEMMYNDGHANWGHRDNILDPMHNKVSIGIAYNKTHVYFVQNFENDYITWNTLNTNNIHQITLSGTASKYTIQDIMIFYDKATPLTTNQISQQQYQGSYSLGTFIASVVQPAPAGTYYIWNNNQIGIEADTWIQNGNSFQITFSLSQAVNRYGTGIYTIYLSTGSSTAESLTTHSIWVTD